MHDRNLIAVIHGKSVKMWNSDLIREFAEDYESDDEDEEKKEGDEKKKEVDEDIVIKGPMNYLFPIMLKQCFYDVFQAK